MEQFITENDKKAACNYAESIIGTVYSHQSVAITEHFTAGCSYKNNQMMEFDKWKEENGWFFYSILSTGEACYHCHHYHGYKTFSELFEIFEKETSK